MQFKTQNDESVSTLHHEVVFTAKNTAIYAGGRLLSHAVGFLMIPVYTRFIVPSNYGAMELIEIVSSCAALLIYLGIWESMPRFYYAEKEECKRNEVVSTIILALGAIGAVIIAILLALSGTLSAVILEDVRSLLCLQIALATLWFALLVEIGFSYLRMLYRAKLFVAITITQLVISLSLNIWFVVFLKWDIVGIFFSNLIVQA